MPTHQRTKRALGCSRAVAGFLLAALLLAGSTSPATLSPGGKQERKPAQQAAPPQAPSRIPPSPPGELPPSEWKEKLAPPNEIKTAHEFYKNIQILGDIPAPKLVWVMKSFSESLGVRCTHCHILGEFSRDDVEAKHKARDMINMVNSIDKEFFPGKTGPTCWTCHRGSVKPEFLPSSEAQRSSQEKRSSVPPDVPWAAADDNRPAEQVYKNIQLVKGMAAFRLKGMMLALNGLLGVECTHCHVAGRWESDDLAAKPTARKMFQMMEHINADFLGGKNALSCWTCHRGNAKPEIDPPPLEPPKKASAPGN